MAYYEWKVCNTSELRNHKFPYLEKTVILENYFDQQYRIWETEHAITLYQPGTYSFVLFKKRVNELMQIHGNNYFRLELLPDGTIDIYHGQES